MGFKVFKIVSEKHGEFNVTIDEEDWPKVKEYKWHIQKHGNLFYVQHSIADYSGSKVKKSVLILSRLVMGATSKREKVDHINHDTLNNSKSNLRIVTSQQNNFNRMKFKKAASSYKGVHKNITYDNGKRYEYWRSRIRIGGKLLSLGVYKVEKDAAIAYNKAAVKHFGDFACLNQIN